MMDDLDHVVLSFRRWQTSWTVYERVGTEESLCLLYIYVYVYVYIQVYIYVYVYVYIQVYIYVFVYVYIQVYIYVCVYVYVYVYVYVLRGMVKDSFTGQNIFLDAPIPGIM